MRYQEYSWSCGPCAIVNSCRVFGLKIPERKIRKFSKTSKELGTDEFGIINALKELNFNYIEYKTKSKKEAINWLTGAVTNSQPTILCVDSWTHWVVIVGKIGSRFILVDSTKTKSNIKENGIHFLSSRQLMRRWVSKEKEMYAIATVKK